MTGLKCKPTHEVKKFTAITAFFVDYLSVAYRKNKILNRQIWKSFVRAFQTNNLINI